MNILDKYFPKEKCPSCGLEQRPMYFCPECGYQFHGYRKWILAKDKKTGREQSRKNPS